MVSRKSVIYRIATGKALGLIVGLIAFSLIPLLIGDSSIVLRLGVLLWYPTVGAIIGIFGIFSYLSRFDLPIPWWLRGALIGAWMNLLLTLITSEQVCTMVMLAMGEYGAYSSPFFMVLEGAVIGLVIDLLITRWFGDGWCNASG